ncbi:trimethylamine methyltransferase family protein [Bacteroidota bacterium]
MRPKVKYLSDELIQQIISEAREILCKLGVEIHNDTILAMLADNGAKVDKTKKHVLFTNELIDKALKIVTGPFKLYDVHGNETNDFSGDNVYFTPGSSGLHILDPETRDVKKPVTEDYIKYAKVVSQLKNIASQSTAFVLTDIHEDISDSYRMFLGLLHCEKPIVTGTFKAESFEVMKNFLVAIRGSEDKLKEKPLSIFSACPTSPLKWSDITSQNVLDCAKYSIPVEFIAMPMAGFISPVTLTGTLVAHTAETLSGIVFSQLANPGTPILYGGSPGIFDVRYETTPMGAVETMMIDCAFNEIGKYLGIPTQAYTSMGDSKHVDAQAGLESAMGATMAALAGINNVSGPGMIDFENCISLDKLVIDNEICGMVLRMVKGIEPKEDFPALPHFEELLKEKHLLISKHSRKYLREEHYFPGQVIDRANRSRWQEEGSRDIHMRSADEIEKLLNNYQPSSLSDDVKNELISLMESEAKKHGQDKLPERN